MNTTHRFSERGSVLVVVLMLLVILSLMGAAAIMTTSTETRIAYNSRQAEESFSAADSGADLAIGIIRYLIAERPDPAGFPSNLRSDLQSVIQDQYLLNEVLAFATNNDGVTDSSFVSPDLRTTVGGNPITVDIDRLGTQFGQGGSAAAGALPARGMRLFFRVSTNGQLASGTTRSNVEVVYRYVIS